MKNFQPALSFFELYSPTNKNISVPTLTTTSEEEIKVEAVLLGEHLKQPEITEAVRFSKITEDEFLKLAGKRFIESRDLIEQYSAACYKEFYSLYKLYDFLPSVDAFRQALKDEDIREMYELKRMFFSSDPGISFSAKQCIVNFLQNGTLNPNLSNITSETMSNQKELLVYGKFKGEIEDVFLSFYVAKDRENKEYITSNLNPSDFIDKTLPQTTVWKNISSRDHEFLTKNLSLLPIENNYHKVDGSRFQGNFDLKGELPEWAQIKPIFTFHLYQQPDEHLFIAIQNSDLKLVKEILDKNPDLINAKTPDSLMDRFEGSVKDTLLEASLGRHVRSSEIALFLIERGANLKADPNIKTGNDVIMAAIYGDKADALTAIIEKGVMPQKEHIDELTYRFAKEKFSIGNYANLKYFVEDVIDKPRLSYEENNIKKKNNLESNQTNMEKKDDKLTTATGRIGSIKFQDLKDKSVLNITIATGKDKETPEWQKVTLWNDLAKEYKDLAVGSKISVSGVEKDNPREKDGIKYDNKYIEAKSLDTYQKISVEGVVGKIENKIAKGEDLKEILLIHNYKEGSEDKAKLYNVALWKDKISLAADLKVGDRLKVEGDARHTKFGEGQMRVTFNNPKNFEITPKQEKAAGVQDEKKPMDEPKIIAEKEQSKEKSKPRNKGVEM